MRGIGSRTVRSNVVVEAAVVDVLNEEGQDSIDLGTRNALVVFVAHHVGASGLLVEAGQAHSLEQIDSDGAGCALDAAAAYYMEDHLGDEGKLAAKEIRRLATERLRSYMASPDTEMKPWQRWEDGGAHFVRLVARVAWLGFAQPALSNGGGVTALSVPFAKHIVAPMRPTVRFRNGQWYDSEGLVLESTRAEALVGVPVLEAGALQALGEGKGCSRLHKVNAHRLVWWLANTARLQVLFRSRNPASIRIEGGWEELARRVVEEATGRDTKRVSRSDADEIKSIVVALERRADVELADGTTGRLLALRTRRPAPGRSGLVELTLTEAWLPYWVSQIPKGSRQGRRARLLVPVLPPPPMPPGVSRQFHPALVTLASDIVYRMADESRLLFQRGGLPLHDGQVVELGQELELSEATVERASRHWQELGVWTRPTKWLLALGARHGEAWRFLRQSGELRTNAAKRKRRR